MEIRWKILLGSFFTVFFLTCLQHLDLARSIPFLSQLQKQTALVSAMVMFPGSGGEEVVKEDIFVPIKEKLASIPNDYALQSSDMNASTAPAFDDKTAYIVTDFDTGEIIAGKLIAEKKRIASITKLMTAVVALDLASPDEHITISERAAKAVPTKMGMRVGESLTLETLLYGLLMTSANDAAAAIAEGIDAKYGEKVFVRAMNEKASLLGLSHTTFDNPAGFDGASHYSSASDVAVLAHYALTKYPVIASMVKEEYRFVKPADNRQFDLYNWNGLLGVYPGVFGVKIGNTGEAGKTTAVVSERNGKRVLVVLLGAPTVLDRDLWASTLLDIGFSQYGFAKAHITESQLRAKYGTWKYFN